MFVRIWAILTGGDLVWLRDHDGEVTLTIARRTPFGDLIAKRFWPTNIRNVMLLPGGEVAGGAYVEEWKYVKN